MFKELWVSVVEEEEGKVFMVRNFCLNIVFLNRFFVKILMIIFC